MADELTRRGHIVTVCDIHGSRYLDPEKQYIDIVNILDEEDVNEHVSRNNVVYNFAGLADLDESSNKPIKTIESNVLGNTIILEACRKHKIKRYVFASTVYVHSNTGSFYRISKLASELIIKNFQKEYGLEYTILRYGSLYGPRCQDNNFIYKTLKEALLYKKITRSGDGEEIREYIHVRDASHLSVDILDERFKNQCINITGNEQIKIKDLFKMIKEILDKDIKIEYKKSDVSHHYGITPYKFDALLPDTGKKLTSNFYHDFGQGLIELLCEIKGEEK